VGRNSRAKNSRDIIDTECGVWALSPNCRSRPYTAPRHATLHLGPLPLHGGEVACSFFEHTPRATVPLSPGCCPAEILHGISCYGYLREDRQELASHEAVAVVKSSHDDDTERLFDDHP
jgi:hypothetical protein